MGVSLSACLKEEENFLYQIRRFNVTISRPKYRFLLLISERFFMHIPRDQESLRMQKALQRMVHGCTEQYRSKSNNGTDWTLYYNWGKDGL